MDFQPYQALPQPILILDRQGRRVFANHAAEGLAQALGVAVTALLPDSHATQPPGTTRLPRQFGERHLEWRLSRFDGAGHRLWVAEETSEAEAQRRRLTQERDAYRELAERTTDLISRHDKDGVFLYASQAAKPLLGFAPEELVGRSAYAMFHPDDLAAMLNKSSRIYHDRGFYQQTYRFRTKQGHYVWFETTSRTQRDPLTGELIDILCVSRDVGRRLLAEAKRERLARVVESTTDYVFFADDEERLGYANEAARHALALPAEGETRLADLYDAESLRLLREVALPASARYGSWSGELCLRGRDGPLPVLTVVLSHQGPAQAPDHLSLLNRDIGLRKRAEAQARTHQQQIAHANRLAATGELASNIAHELNQPLGAIANYASGALMRIAADPTLPAGELEAPLTRLNEQVARLSARLRHIRQFIRKGQIRPRPTDLNRALHAAARLCDWQFGAEGIALRLNLAADLPPVRGDATALEQVAVNLLLNALEASREHPGATRVCLESFLDGPGRVGFAVSDQGPGLADEAQAFTTFYSTKAEGLGMGLAIGRSLMEAMGGELRYRPMATGGARFVGTLRAETPTGPAAR